MVLFPGRILEQADRLLATGREREAFLVLRRLSIEQFGRMMFEPPARWPALAGALPAMPGEQVQRDWTGNTGRALLAQTCAFVRSLEKAFRQLRGRTPTNDFILDYGCGWGRILRLMYRYSDFERIHGLDAWTTPLEICRATRVRGNLARCDDVPRQLPFNEVRFDLIYAFSVFTHLSPRTADAVMTALHQRISPDGLLAMTVRPLEFWHVYAPFPPGTDADTMRARHLEHGFAFLPHHRDPIEGDITFGEASISIEYIERQWPAWRLVGRRLNRVDPYQLVLFLRPR